MLYCFGRQEGGQTKQTLQLSIIIIYHERETYSTTQRAAWSPFIQIVCSTHRCGYEIMARQMLLLLNMKMCYFLNFLHTFQTGQSILFISILVVQLKNRSIYCI